MPIRHAMVAVTAVLAVAMGTGGAVAQAPLGTGCAAQAENDARVRALFAPLLGRFQEVVGTTVGCVADAPDGGLTQLTTTGLLYARPEEGGPVRIVVFTDGHRHWAVDANLRQITLYWEDDAAYPPATGVTRLPVPAEVAAAEAPWPPSPAPTVGRLAPTPVPAHRPATGEDIAEPTYVGGRGSVTLVNGLPVDLAFKLRDGDGARATRAFVYVRAGERARLGNVQAGVYEIQCIAGSDWVPDARVFQRGLRAFKADEPFELTETSTDEGITWVNWTLTIAPLGDSNVELVSIDLAEFQQD